MTVRLEMSNSFTPEQALQNILAAAQEAKLSFREHVAVQESGKVLREFIDQKRGVKKLVETLKQPDEPKAA